MVFQKTVGILTLLLFCSCKLSYGQTEFRSITVNDGLSQNWIRCIYQDDLGFMWFGTSGGLNKYNGYDFKVYNLGNVNVNAIARKNKQELWICNDLGVFIYNSDKDTILTFHRLKGQSIFSVLQEEDGTVWFGSNTGLYKYSLTKDKIYSYYADDKTSTGLNSNYINTIFLDSDHNIWIGTNAGLNRYNRKSNTFEKYQLNIKPGESGSNDIFSICEDRNKRLWIGTSVNGIHLLTKDGNKYQSHKIADGLVKTLLIDNKDVLWIGMSSGGGIQKIDLNHFSIGTKPEIVHIKRNRIDPHSISDNSIFYLYEDKYDDIWIGTFGGGVNYFTYRSKNFFHIKEGIHSAPVLRNDLVNAILEEDKYIWIGTEDGLELFNKQTKNTKHFSYTPENPNSLSSNPIYALLKDSRGNLWIGTWLGGLNLYNYNNETFKRYTPDEKPGSISSENIFALYEDSKNNLWIGTVGGGLNRFNYESGTFKSYRHDPQINNSLYSDIIHSIGETYDGRLLIAAFGSLDIFDSLTGNFKHYPINSFFKDSTLSRYVITIFKDSRRNIWLGTNDGLIMFNEDKAKSYVFTMENGLAGNTVQGIVEDDKGNLWISTRRGLSRFNRAIYPPHSSNFTNFDESDGLSGNDFNKRATFKNHSGYIYLGSSQGFSYFHPDSISLNQIPPEIVLTEMHLLKYPQNSIYSVVKKINSIHRIELPFSRSDFEISFAALNYLNPHKNKYQYMLSGYDRHWILAEENRKATYKNLRPGEYTFMVMGSNNDGVWNTKPKKLQIIIIPPFWHTIWFRSLLILVFLGIVALVFHWRINSIKKEKRILEEIISERTIELLDANKKLEQQSEELSTQNEELEIYKDQLEDLVAQRTSELEKAKSKAEESDRLKTMFLANMSHEIRTPLNAIAGFSSLISDPGISEEERKNYNQIIQSNTESLLQLINDILDLSTIAANQLRFHKALFAPFDVFNEVYQQFLSHANNEVKLILCIDIKLKSIQINSDEYRFRQILTNLISNAFKFTERGYIEIGYIQENQDQVTFYVKDTGIGISQEQQELIFNHFTKVENTRKLFRGAGLGLAICRQLTDLMGGKIWLESEPGKGSTFYFSHPVN